MHNCNLKPVNSALIKQVGYNPMTSVLCVEFRDGAVYHYSGVPSSVYEGMMLSSSMGHYFDTYVKKAGYSYTRER